jgi:hypothetical protein
VGIFVAVGAGILLVVIVIVALASGGGGKPKPTPREAPPRPKNETKVPGEDPRDRAAKEAMEKASAFARMHPGDLDGQIAAWDEAVLKTKGTRHASHAVQAQMALLQKRKRALRKEFEELRGKVGVELQKEAFKAAIDLYEGARGAHDAVGWRTDLDASIRGIHTHVDKLFKTLKAEAADARVKGEADKEKEVLERVARWGFPERLSELKAHMASFESAGTIKGSKKGLVAYWKLNEGKGDTAANAVGGGYDAKLQFGAGWSPDVPPGTAPNTFSLLLEGNGDHLLVNKGKDLLNGLQAFTLALWVRANNVATDRGLVIACQPEGHDDFFTLRYDAKGANKEDRVKLIKAGITTTQGKLQLESSSNVQTTQWQHLALTWRSGKALTLYVNGVRNDSGEESTKSGKITGASRLMIGMGSKDKLGEKSWAGLIDDVRLYNRVLSEGEIKELAGK